MQNRLSKTSHGTAFLLTVILCVFLTLWGILFIFNNHMKESSRVETQRDKSIGEKYQSTVTFNEGHPAATPSPPVQRPDDRSAD